MTRFNITINEAIKLAVFSSQISKGDEIIMPKLPSYRIIRFSQCHKTKINIKSIKKWS